MTARRAALFMCLIVLCALAIRLEIKYLLLEYI